MNINIDLNDVLYDYWGTYVPSDIYIIAIAVSGGADSMALAHALAMYCADKGICIHALSVDHGLRPEARDEALLVQKSLSVYDHVRHEILTWEHEEEVHARLQETARAARYGLMEAYMLEHGIKHLFLGHHMDDQAETFLFRLAKGSGLDGLSCMHPVQDNGDIYLMRPFLGISKSKLIAFCQNNKISYIDDPSNENTDFARVRLRKSMDVLSEEGLTPKRLAVTAQRMARARKALDNIARTVFEQSHKKDGSRIVFDFKELILNEEEVFFRVIDFAMKALSHEEGYGVRKEKFESLCEDLLKLTAFRTRTLGGVIFMRDDKNDLLIMECERR